MANHFKLLTSGQVPFPKTLLVSLKICFVNLERQKFTKFFQVF